MSETEVTMTEQSSSANDLPGHRLAEERKARGLSVEQVAAQLRLTVSTVQALESDDYSRLPPAAYVSGYLRSYARALGLAESEIVHGPAPVAMPAPAPAETNLGGVRRISQVRATDPRVRAVSYLVVGGLLLLSSAWWLLQQDEAPAEPGLPAAVEAVPQPLPIPVIDPAAAPGAPDAAAETANTDPVPAAPAPAPGAGTGATTPPAPVAAPKPPVAPVAPAANPAATPSATSPATPAAEAAPAKPVPPPLTAATPQSKVVLEFTADCWVDVTDAAGRKLMYDLGKEGRRLTLRGEAPFTVFFGYSPAVQVRFNDEPFDHRPYQRRDMARFKLGTAEDNVLPTEAQ